MHLSRSKRWWTSLALIAWVVGLLVPVAGAQPRDVDTASAPADSSDVSNERAREPETVVVTASRKEQALEEVPASVSVLGSKLLEESPADNYADLLRGVPGVNIAQTSGHDISISTRTATNVIPQGQLAMMDHRSFYQDFNGFVLWSSVPVELEDIKRIEVVRGPGSAVWGANALHGIVHIVTKAPKEMVGTRVKLAAGELDTGHANVTHAGVQGKLGYRISAGYSTQGPFSRPTGSIPGTEGPASPGGTPYPNYDNVDSKATRVNARVDYDVDERTTFSVSGGYAGSEGIFMSPGGPSRTDQGSYHAFGKFDWTRDAIRVTGFFNQDTYQGVFLLGETPITQNDQTYNLDFSNTSVAGARHILTYGGNVRYNAYDNDLAADGDSRDSYGVFLQDDIQLVDPLRLVAGARWDYIDAMGNAISPRASLLYTPWRDQQLRFSYNRAFQAPSVLQNYIDAWNRSSFDLPDFNDPGSGSTVPVVIPFRAVGNTELEAKRLDAFEVGWSGRFGGRTQLSLTAYLNDFRNAFQQVVGEYYTADDPPPDWPFDPALLDGPLAGALPKTFTTVNLGRSTEVGIEVGGELQLSRAWSLFGNYSWQDAPEVEDYETVQLPNGSEALPINLPPKHRFNVGAAWDVSGYYANAAVTYQDQAFWTDVLDARFWGPTEAFTMVNVGAGVRLLDESLVLSVNGLNIFDERVQQHVWGDIIDRRWTGQIAYRF